MWAFYLYIYFTYMNCLRTILLITTLTTYYAFGQTSHGQKFKTATDSVYNVYLGKKEGIGQFLTLKNDSICHLTIHSGPSCWFWEEGNIKFSFKNDTIVFHIEIVREEEKDEHKLNIINIDEVFVFKHDYTTLIRISSPKKMADRYDLTTFLEK